MKTDRISPVVVAYLSALLSTASADLVTDWNATLRLAIQLEGDSEGKANPGWSTRAMAMMNAAIYDCVQAIDRTHVPFYATPEAPEAASKEAAIIQAAHDVATELYSSQIDLFDVEAATGLERISQGPQKSAGIALGAAVAQAYLTWRAEDGADGSVLYEVTPDPGRWEPDLLNPDQPAWGPAWGSVKTFCMGSSSQFQPPRPPELDSPEYTEAFNEVKSLGQKVSATRTRDRTEMGYFWGYDRAHLGPPPVMYNLHLATIAGQMGTTLEQNARLFAMGSVAMADAAIAAWDCKFLDDFWRPISGIRRAEDDGNPATSGDPNWEPLGAPGLDGKNFTPPFPAYVSGHATMGEAVFSVLATFFGTDQMDFRLTSEELPGVERSFTRFSQASDENAYSRVYLGIHWNFDSIEGQKLGRRVAELVTSNYFRPLPTLLTVSYAGSGVILEWEGNGTLQVSSTLKAGSWQDLPEAKSPAEMTIVEPEMYFRLIRFQP